MDIISDNDIDLLDLPDEILLTIFKKLNMIDMFYSLTDVNQRFDRLAYDFFYSYHLNFAIKRENTHILDKICSKILPRINQKITQLTLEPLCMERVLATCHYPQLHSLSFVNFDPETLLQYLTSIVLNFILFYQLLIVFCLHLS